MKSIVRTFGSAAIILATLGLSHGAAAKDAFGLDQFKAPAESITKPKQPYRTKYGNQINVYTIKSPSSKADDSKIRRFLIQGGLHGNELLPSEFVAWLAQRFAKGESLLNTLNSGNIEIDFIPYANPDGTVQLTRYNGNKINLNRNFGVLWGTTKENPGPAPFSESETRAIRDLLSLRAYSGAIDVHGYVNWIVLPTSPEDNMDGFKNYSPEKIAEYKKWANVVYRETQKRMPGYEVKTAGSLGDGGAFEDYAWWGANVPATCLEVFSDDRYIAKTVAAKLVDLVTPKALGISSSMSGMSDTFIVYESYIHSLFREAIKLKDDTQAESQFASKTK